MAIVPKALTIVLISNNSIVKDNVSGALAAINSENLQVINDSEYQSEKIHTLSTHKNLQKIVKKANNYLRQYKDKICVHLIAATSKTGAINKLKKEQASEFTVGLVILDQSSKDAGYNEENLLKLELDEFYSSLEVSDIKHFRSSYSDMVFISESQWHPNPYLNSIFFQIKCISDEKWVFQADVLCYFLNYLQHTYLNKFAQRRLKSSEGENFLGGQLVKFMETIHGSNWLVSFLTGSVVSSLIKQVVKGAEAIGAYSLVGPSEHSMVCGAFINWKLYQRSYLLIITSAMIDEFKGTLANLQQIGAKGFIVCADTKPNKWFGFQGTINTDGDIRKVLEAKNIPYIYMQAKDDKESDLEAAFRLYYETDGPVVIIATQDVLESRDSLQTTLEVNKPAQTAPELKNNFNSLAPILEIINSMPVHIIWQCGALTEEETEIAINITRKAGIAICEALSSPGNISRYFRGKRVENHLGVLGQYGTSQEIFDFLHTNGKLNTKDEQYLFVIKGKFGQIDSPFSDGTHERKLNIVHINKRQEHLAPFADISLCMPAADFLSEIEKHINVEPEILTQRLNKIRQFITPKVDALSLVPSLPMTPNYFFHELNKTIEGLIDCENYEYIGMYDVGHCGTLATRNVSRTGPSYSGWYGRGLMGDALQATGFLAFSAHTNVVSFVGDGAKNITADILPGLLENIKKSQHAVEKNVTIFFFMNNMFSLINSYQERIMFKPGGRQMTLTNVQSFTKTEEWEKEFCGVTIKQSVLRQYDAQVMKQILTRKSSINFVYIPLVSNNDGISIADIDNWQYC